MNAVDKEAKCTVAIERNTPKVTVIILTINQRDTTLRCLRSLAAIKAPPFQVVLWDNGSEDGTAAAVQEAFPRVLVHYHAGNLGVAAGRNAAAELAVRTFNSTHLLFLDNDMVLEPGFVAALLQPFAADTKLGQTQGKLLFMHDRKRINDGGGARVGFLSGQIVPVGFREIDRGQCDQPRTCVACGGAMMVRTEVFQQLGGFDTRFSPYGPEDIDFSLRLAKAGYYALYVPDAVAYHEANHTYGKGYTEDYARDKARFWLMFVRRHAPLPEKLAFFLVGIPYLAIRVMARQGRKRNLRAFRGSVRGILDSLGLSSARRA